MVKVYTPHGGWIEMCWGCAEKAKEDHQVEIMLVAKPAPSNSPLPIVSRVCRHIAYADFNKALPLEGIH